MKKLQFLHLGLCILIGIVYARSLTRKDWYALAVPTPSGSRLNLNIAVHNGLIDLHKWTTTNPRSYWQLDAEWRLRTDSREWHETFDAIRFNGGASAAGFGLARYRIGTRAVIPLWFPMTIAVSMVVFQILKSRRDVPGFDVAPASTAQTGTDHDTAGTSR